MVAKNKGQGHVTKLDQGGMVGYYHAWREHFGSLVRGEGRQLVFLHPELKNQVVFILKFWNFHHWFRTSTIETLEFPILKISSCVGFCLLFMTTSWMLHAFGIAVETREPWLPSDQCRVGSIQAPCTEFPWLVGDFSLDAIHDRRWHKKTSYIIKMMKILNNYFTKLFMLSILHLDVFPSHGVFVEGQN